MSLLLASIAAGVAFCVQLSVDALVAGELAPILAFTIVGVFVALAGGGALLEIFRTWTAEKLGLGYVADIRAQLFDHLLRVSPGVLAQRGQGGLLLPFVGDLSALKKWVSDGLVRLISATAVSVLLLTALGLQSSALAMAAGAIVAVGAVAVLLLSGSLSRAITETRKRRGVVASFVSRSLRAAGSIRAFNRFRRENNRLARRNAALVEASLSLARISGLMAAIVHVTGLALVVAALAIGAIEVQAGQLSVGGVVAAISVSGLLAGAVRDLGIAFDLWRRASVSLAKIKQVLSVELAVAAPRAERSVRAKRNATVSLRDVGVDGVFGGVTFEVDRGEIVNVSGESGAGKSTLLAIIARLADPGRGRVRVLGRDARDLKVGALRNAIGFAGAATPLLVGSVAMNIRYRVPDASDEDVAKVIAVCELETTVARLADGLSSKLGEGAPELSASERQKLQLARALLGQPELLVLDEIDRDMDGAEAARIIERLTQYPGAIVMAAASPAWRTRATKTFVIDNGAVRPESTPGVRLSLIDGGAAARDGGDA
ncbi:MAG: ABC transporter ATP-binding protein [Terricaulis sp.]